MEPCNTDLDVFDFDEEATVVDPNPPAKGQDVNGALRRAYESTVDEAIPQSLLDLLGKLD